MCGLKGLPDSITTTWQYATVQTCIIHLVRNTFRYASRADWEKLAKDLRSIYRSQRRAGRGATGEFGDKSGSTYPAIMSLLRNA